jgi:hypothetical protein
MDVDLAIATAAPNDPVKTATGIMESLGLSTGIVREADFAGGPLFAIKQKLTLPVMVVGRQKNKRQGPGLDILLPSLPWTAQAISRAEHHLVDFGFGPVPVLRLEDVILSKLYALQSSELRAKDLDDLQSIYASEAKPDYAYMSGQLAKIRLKLSPVVMKLIPKSLKSLCREAVR